jgi:hypothetical protein
MSFREQHQHRHVRRLQRKRCSELHTRGLLWPQPIIVVVDDPLTWQVVVSSLLMLLIVSLHRDLFSILVDATAWTTYPTCYLRSRHDYT